ncbi:MAG: glutamate--cysteine ligase [Gammaproteobacteria bacterium]|nr:glutamate--cysteine ligase [Gammaproteobacteria bacterium]
MARGQRAYGKTACRIAATTAWYRRCFRHLLRKRTTRSLVRPSFEQRFNALCAADATVLAGGRKGIEKEALRVDSEGYLSHTAHPAALGSALTNAYITTDFSEALLEFITPAFSSTWEALQFLCDVQQFTYQRLGDELLWGASMPCRIPADASIPLARYGSSNVGQMKTIYRRGLGYRYGRSMQTIAGVHFNYSLPESFWPVYQRVMGADADATAFRSAQYLALIRNFRRFGWLLLYLFGASPAMCKSFGASVEMPSLNPETWFEPYGTSLRMSDLGYSNKNQSSINISLNDLDSYVRDLSEAIETPEPEFQKIGVKVDGVYRQLSINRLQIENEYYSSIRPKRVAMSGERPTAALRRGGIEYVEVRSLDISIDDPAGINQNTMRFIEAFLIYCLMEDSPHFDDAGLDETKRNQTETAKRGRDPAFRLKRGGEDVPLADWASAIVQNVQRIAEAIDAQEGCDGYLQAVRQVQHLIEKPSATPSARVLDQLQQTNSGFFDFALAVAIGHRDYFASITPLSAARDAQFADEAVESLQRQRDVEAADTISFDQYLKDYFSSANGR